MTFPPPALISAAELAGKLAAPDLVVVDCRFNLADPAWGEKVYLEAHIPSAVYAHLDRDLSAPVVPGQTGRHPLPSPDTLARTFAAWGIGPGVEVVAYDAAGGALAAARLWWLLRWVGHDDVRVLDGGWQAWQELAAHPPPELSTGPSPLNSSDHATDTPGQREAPNGSPWHHSGPEAHAPRVFRAEPHSDWIVNADEVARMIAAGQPVFDARAADRYRGESETIDPVAGHIPGARSLPFAANLGPDGRFRSASELASRFEAALGGSAPEASAAYCGSGVTAAHLILAMVHAGLGVPRLYAGSWSEWITDAGRPVATGEEA